jgi:NAD kinase
MLGVNDIAEKFDFSVYPIPAKDDLNIRSERKIKSVSVFSMDGKRVYKVEKQDVKNINVSMLPTGTYFLQVKDEKGNISQTKFIKN